LSAIRGSGPSGRVIKKDVELALASFALQDRSRSPLPSCPPLSQEPVPGGRLLPLSKMRETIARRMQESSSQAPHFYMSATIDMDQAVRLRENLKERPEYQGLSINHLVIKAAAYAISREPRINCSIRSGKILEPDQINIGIITATDDGLLIPILKQADRLPLKDLVRDARTAVERARAGHPTAEDLTGGTFSISNMGMFAVENFTAIINPGQGAVLAVGAVHLAPIVKNTQIVIASVMKVTVSVDHRVSDAVIAAGFLRFFKEGIENPALLMV
jgi:pyruvate dehydrogenase E2 component (dihydrolipoamide acetyltransferase)